MENANVNANINLEKYNYYKGKVDLHLGMANKYKGYSKSKYKTHYKHYKLYHEKMIGYAKKCGHHHHHMPEKVCETHTHYKHYYHHHHIDVHHHECQKPSHHGGY